MTIQLRNGIWHWKKMVQGHVFARSTKTGDKKTAETLAALWEAEAIKEVMLNGNKPVFLKEALDAFLKEREGTGGYHSARNHIKHFYAIPNLRMNDVQLSQVQAVIAKRRDEGTAHNTLVVASNYWNAVCTFCEKQKWTTGPRLPRVEAEQTRLRYLSADEERRLFTAIDPNAKYRGKNPKTDRARQDNTDLLLFLLHMGCRFSEASEMRWNQIDLATRKVLMRRKKRGVDNTLVMSDRVYEMLNRRKGVATDEWVFSSKKKFNNNSLWLKAALERAGISEAEGRITLHTARHTYASRMLNSGMSLVEVQSLLGHRKISSTMIYSHVEAGAVAEKAARVLSEAAQ
jgi:integrase